MPLACPHCGSDQVRSASLHAHDGLRRMLFSTALRCRDCRHRFWVSNPLKPIGLVLVVSILVGLTVWLTLDQRTDAVVHQASDTLPHKRAAQGDAEAQLQLGQHYAEGDGVIRNDKEAAKWFALAAKQGLSEAQYHYGLMLLKGRGVVQDYRAAFEWIEKPAKRGYAKAQYSLGELYRYGTGTPIDKARAYLWFNLAASQGVDAAAKARDSLVWQLKPEQIAEMQEEARRMTRPTHMVPPGGAATRP
ncbi:MAG: sel1 repeat family protein [Thiobacillus sp.]|nr:sel1 repeat family protein [Thiobacillus sp.]